MTFILFEQLWSWSMWKSDAAFYALFRTEERRSPLWNQTDFSDCGSYRTRWFWWVRFINPPLFKGSEWSWAVNMKISAAGQRADFHCLVFICVIYLFCGARQVQINHQLHLSRFCQSPGTDYRLLTGDQYLFKDYWRDISDLLK